MNSYHLQEYVVLVTLIVSHAVAQPLNAQIATLAKFLEQIRHAEHHVILMSFWCQQDFVSHVILIARAVQVQLPSVLVATPQMF